jgi:hypothetical protein
VFSSILKRFCTELSKGLPSIHHRRATALITAIRRTFGAHTPIQR